MQRDDHLDVSLVLRAARRDADLSQQQLAAAVGLSQPCVATYETRSRDVSVRVLDLLLRRCGWRLVVVDADGQLVQPEPDARRDRGGRRFPAHLDVRRTGERGDWWGDYYPGVWGVPERPTWTYHLDRRYRNARRAGKWGRRALDPLLGSPAMDDTELLAAFDTQVRRSAQAPAGFRLDLVSEPAPVLRLTPDADDAACGGGVFWCDLDEETADAAIAAAVEWFRPRGKEFEWKHYGYDRPADLPDRLRAAGFEPDAEEALVVGEVDQVRAQLAQAPQPTGVTFRRLHDDHEGRAADWRAIADLRTAVWGDDGTGMTRAIAAEHAADPSAMSVWLAVADDGTVVCSARVQFHEGTDFASLWGGGTLAAYRGRGIYKALVSRRAEEAAERGYRFLQVDASPDSRPILERLGLRALTSTTPWVWRP